MGLPLEDDQRESLVEAVMTNFRHEEEVKRISNTSFSQGKKSAEDEFEKRTRKDESESVVEEPVQKVQAGQQTDSIQLGALTEITKSMKRLEEQVKDLRGENEKLRTESKQRDITNTLVEAIQKKGFADPQTVLLLARKDADFVEDGSGGLIAVRADDKTMPYNGAGTYTSHDEFFESFKSSDVGKRFVDAPAQSTSEAGIRGGQEGTPSKPGPFSEESLAGGFKQLGV